MARKAYDHTRYAGNLGDLWKHAGMLGVLARMLETARASDGPFCYGETHGGPGGVTLPRSGEWERGVGRLLKLPQDGEAGRLTGALAHLRRTGVYPGSWRLAADCCDALATEPWSLRVCELSEDVFAHATAARAGAPHPERTELWQTDGFAALEAAAPLRSLAACHLVLIDPPYTQVGDLPHDWERVHRAVAACERQGTPCLVWYPVFWFNNPQRLVDTTGLPGLELIWAELEGSRPGYASKGAGLLASGKAAAHLEAAAAELADLAIKLGGRLARREPRPRTPAPALPGPQESQ